MSTREKIVLALAGILLLSLTFLLVLQRTRTGQAEERLAETQLQLSLQRHESALAMAALEAGRGSYELARQLASEAFSGLQTDATRAPDGARAALTEILGQRDAMITALSRSDPQSAPQLLQLLIRYRVAMGERVGPDAGTAAPAAPAAPAPDTSPTTTGG